VVVETDRKQKLILPVQYTLSMRLSRCLTRGLVPVRTVASIKSTLQMMGRIRNTSMVVHKPQPLWVRGGAWRVAEFITLARAVSFHAFLRGRGMVAAWSRHGRGMVAAWSRHGRGDPIPCVNAPGDLPSLTVYGIGKPPGYFIVTRWQ
jgi:hypothetical protein